jgi:hypothetical protein
MPLTLTTTATSADYCAANSSETAGVGIAFTSPQLGNHRAQAFSTSTNSFWDVNVTVTQGQCSTVRLTCANGSCGDSTFPNFGYVTAQADRTIQACVRDYECEDGDRVSVDFGSAAGGPRTDVFTSQELLNAPVCRSIAVSASGVYTFSLFAVNGTGFKGACNYGDSNTGELTINGVAAAARWALRGGTGSRTNGYVRVP